MNNPTPIKSGQPLHRYSRRRGMALLFVVSLILFITLLGASFVVVSMQFSTSAKLHTRIDARGDSNRAMIYRSLYDVLRGPEPGDTKSPLRGHSLLEDMYGYGVRSDGGAAVVANGFVPGAFDVNFAAESVIDGSVFTLSSIDDHYNGQLLTFTSGAGRGISCRIIDYVGATQVFTVLPEPGNSATLTAADLNNSQLVVNGKPFSGFGAGGAAGNALGPDALLPRRMFDGPLATTAPDNSAINGYISTGVNESYDAWDYQNMFLAMYDNLPGADFKASFNRPNLFTYVESTSATDEEKYTNFRPFTADYVDSGPGTIVDAGNGWANPSDALDVDNDGDGVLDSIWMDLGYPVKTDIDGRRYKTLTAFMILDMDSRLNVNAHGNGFQLDPFVPPGSQSTSYAGNLLGEIDPTASNLPKGQYLGSPEVSLLPLFDGAGLPAAAAVMSNLISSRNGPDDLPGIGNLTGDPVDLDFRDNWMAYENWGYPDTANRYGEVYPNQFVGGLFGTNLDFHGRYTIGIPQIGIISDTPIARPALAVNSNFTNTGNEIASSQYELSLFPESRSPMTTTDTSDDQPFRTKEMERFLRPWDRDTKMLPDRLWNIASGDMTADDRYFLTTDSFEVPALPSFDNGAGIPVSIVEYVDNLLDPMDTNQAWANTQIQILLAPEVRLGLPMNLNRPFGNGRDDNAPQNGVYDEHWQTTDDAGNPIPTSNQFDESAIGEQILDVQGTPVSLDTDADTFAANSHLARQIFARHLFVLGLLATGDTGTIVPDFTYPIAGDTARRVALAQWAINVVDFRDSDSINTPFEIDVNPFNSPGTPDDGWGVDGWLGLNPNTGIDDSINADRFVVWGAERPELLLSETMATHDRRTQDLGAIGGGDTSSGDDDFDSKLVPRSAGWFELYHPWNQNDSNQLLPAELTDPAGTGIDIRRVTPGTNDPVWRILVTRGTSLNQNPDLATIAEADVARKVYFVPPDLASTEMDRVGTGPAYTGEKVFFPGTPDPAVITRGGFAVIGSSGVGSNARAGEVFFGRRSDIPPPPAPFDPVSMATTRRLHLVPGIRQVIVYEPDDGTNAVNTITRNDVAGVIIDQHYDPLTMAAAARSLGLSDPDDGYASFGVTNLIADGFEFVTGLDEPVDGNPADPYRDFKMTDGVSPGFSEAHLQRLANPLAPYDQVTNPYITVDTKSLDLVSFNGAQDDSPDQASANPNALITPGQMVFSSGERGRLFDQLYRNIPPPPSPISEQIRRWLWKREEPTSDLAQSSLKAWFLSLMNADFHVHSFNLYETLGEINGSYTDAVTPRFPRPVTNLTSGPNPPIGFSGFNWNNRPFAGHMDLLDVPYPDNSDMLSKYSIYSVAGFGPYVAAPDIGEFGHLVNFFAAPTPGYAFPSGMAALLDFVRVPSRWAGTRQHLNSALPPFNVLSKYREPGKINVNTISNVGGTNSPVWEGLLGVYAIGTAANGQLLDSTGASYGFDPLDNDLMGGFEGSRRGVVAPMPGAGPSVFDNPFRTANEFEKIPPGGYAITEPVQVTLLRNEAPTVTPMFDYPQVPGLELPFASPARDAAARHDVFRKLANTTTTRSSVFAVWITVGRFEVDENDRLLGPALVELGSDTGKVRRGRGFFIIDRSIPVAAEPGKNHNVDKTILVETIIE